MEVVTACVLLLSLVSLHISGASEVDSCPAVCTCSEWNYHIITCYEIDHFPRFPASTKTLWLFDTNWPTLSADAFLNMVNITKIYMSVDARLQKLERHSFYGLKKIIHIEIQNVKIFLSVAFSEFLLLDFNLVLCSVSFCSDITDNPYIAEIPPNAFRGITSDRLTVNLYGNGLKKIHHHAFNGTRLDQVDLHRNTHLTKMDDLAFAGVISGPMYLDVSQTAITSLPTTGLDDLRKLQAHNVFALKKLPPIMTFKDLTDANLTYPSHCCAFKDFKKQQSYLKLRLCKLLASNYRHHKRSVGPLRMPLLQRDSVLETFADQEPDDEGHSDAQQDWRRADYPSSLHFHAFFGGQPDEDVGFGDILKNPQEDNSQGFEDESEYEICNDGEEVACAPVPDEFNPCEDIMGFSFLRVSVWFVSLLAVLGNMVVLLVLLTSHYKLSVSRFLMCHLAFADLCMGIYLLLIASVDLHTRTEYFNYAIDWQTGPGCGLAGFFTVFASELSVYTLTVITLERWYAITFAMRLDRKLRLQHAAAVMLGGWVFCLIMALLPLVGVSSFQKVSICLPMDTQATAAQVYIMSVLVLNTLAFFVICGCYVKIYCTVHNPHYRSGSKDTNIAKRMAVLIFTDFLCMAPISFYAMSAVLDRPLITVSNSKILLVLFYPLNSCANPFLYAIFTKAFRGDVFILLSKVGLCQQRAQLFRGQTVSSKGSSGTSQVRRDKARKASSIRQEEVPIQLKKFSRLACHQDCS
uniref:Thyrotropin receptor n=1 Tax=Gouania willdenowi TaxID=441366 RepID=A0A8C5HHZ3_GOUWI